MWISFNLYLTHECRGLERLIEILGLQCNVRQGTLQKNSKISIKNSKCAVSNKHIQDDEPGRYENRKRSKIKAKADPTPTQERECPRCHHPEGERIRNCASWQQKDRVSAEKCQMKPFCPKMRNDARGQTDDQPWTVMLLGLIPCFITVYGVFGWCLIY